MCGLDSDVLYVTDDYVQSLIALFSSVDELMSYVLLSFMHLTLNDVQYSLSLCFPPRKLN